MTKTIEAELKKLGIQNEVLVKQEDGSAHEILLVRDFSVLEATLKKHFVASNLISPTKQYPCNK